MISRRTPHAKLAALAVLVLIAALSVAARADKKPLSRAENGKILLQAIRRGDVTPAIEMLEARADVNYHDRDARRTPLLAAVSAFAAHRGSIDVVHWLLKAGADPNFRGRRGWTALTSAAHHDVDSVIAPLLKA